MSEAVLQLPAYPRNRQDSALGDEAKTLRELFAEVTEKLDATQVYGNPLANLTSVFWNSAMEDWDGDGATAVDGATYMRARAFLRALPVTVPEPAIAADPDGEISFTWVRDRTAMLAVSIDGSGRLNFAGVFDSKTNYGQETFVDEIPQVVRNNIARLFP